MSSEEYKPADDETVADFEVIAELTSPLEAELAAGRLEAAGIETRIEQGGILGTSWLNPGHSGGISVAVRSDKAGEARLLLQSIETDHEIDIPPEYREDADHQECPECGSTHKTLRREHPIMALLAMSRYFRQFRGDRWHCRKCGNIWIVDGPTKISGDAGEV